MLPGSQSLSSILRALAEVRVAAVRARLRGMSRVSPSRLLLAALAALAAGLAASLALPARAGATLDRVRAKGVMVDVVNPSYPPFSFLNDQNQIDGFDIDVARAVAARIGVKLKVETPSWEILTTGSWRGRYDVGISSLTPDSQKAAVLVFVAPYYDAPAVLVISAQDSSVHALRDLAGKRVGVEQGSSYERYLQKRLEIATPDARPLAFPFDRVRIATYAYEDLAFQDLALGAGKRIDAVVSNEITARMRIKRMPGKFQVVGAALYQEPNWVVTDRGDPEWERLLARTIADLAHDGTLSRLSLKWLGQDVSRH